MSNVYNVNKILKWKPLYMILIKLRTTQKHINIITLQTNKKINLNHLPKSNSVTLIYITYYSVLLLRAQNECKTTL